MPKIRSRPGQVALIVTLVVLVGLTVGVAVLSRSASTVNISTQEEERARSFSAAEAGIEDALHRNLAGFSGASFSVGSSSVDYTVDPTNSFSIGIYPGDVVTIDWDKGTATNVRVSWSNCRAMSATSISSSGNVTRSVSTGSSTTIFKGSNSLLRLRFINCTAIPTNITLDANGNTATLSFYRIDSAGTDNQSNSRVEVIKSEPAAIGLMDFAVFSGGIVQ